MKSEARHEILCGPKLILNLLSRTENSNSNQVNNTGKILNFRTNNSSGGDFFSNHYGFFRLKHFVKQSHLISHQSMNSEQTKKSNCYLEITSTTKFEFESAEEAALWTCFLPPSPHHHHSLLLPKPFPKPSKQQPSPPTPQTIHACVCLCECVRSLSLSQPLK